MNRQIELHIEELVLHGFAGADRDRIALAVQRELVQLISTSGLPTALRDSRDQERVDGGLFRIAPKPTGEQIGTRVGQAVYKGLSRSE